MGAVAMRLRAELRQRWRAWLSLALILGVSAGASITAIAGARRTNSAYPRFENAQDAFDAMTGGGGSRGFTERYAMLKTYPQIKDFTEIVLIGAEVTLPARRGLPEQVLAFPEWTLATDPSGRTLYTTNRAKVLEGRMADRSRPDETIIPFTIAEQFDLRVGDEIVVGVGFDFENFPAPLERVRLTVVGISAAPGEFEMIGQTFFRSFYATPALYQRFREVTKETYPPKEAAEILAPNPDTWQIGLHLKGGRDSAVAFKRAIERDLNIDVPIIEPIVRSSVQKIIRLYAVALWLLGALIAAATVAVVGQTFARQQLLESVDYPTLRAMGLSRRHLVTLGMLRASAIGLVAAGLAAMVAYLLSPFTPIGPARVAEPRPGFAFDAAAIGLGAAAVLLVAPLATLWPSIRAARWAARAASDIEEGTRRPSRVVGAMTRVSRSPATATGLRMALEPGRGRTAVPVRSTILAVALGVASVGGSVVVGRSLNNLVETPALTGFTYDAILPSDESRPTQESSARRLADLKKLPFVDRAVIGSLLNVAIGNRDMFLLGFNDGGEIGYALIEGRAPKDTPPGAVPEMALGPATLRRLGLRVGDTLEFGYPDPTQVEEEESGEAIVRRIVKRLARIVGVAAVPSFPFAAVEPGEGAIMSASTIRRLDPQEPGSCCFVGFKPGTNLEAARRQLVDDGFEVFLRTKRQDLAALEKISRLPVLLSAIFAAIASAALAHVLVTAIRRRRRDLAILKALGFVASQVRGAIAWQVSTIAVLAIVVGIPAGIVLGRWGWRLIALQFGVVPVSVAPLAVLALVLPAGLVLGNLIAALPGRSAARTQPALVLRAE